MDGWRFWEGRKRDRVGGDKHNGRGNGRTGIGGIWGVESEGDEHERGKRTSG